jgi:hypothetical protein
LLLVLVVVGSSLPVMAADTTKMKPIMTTERTELHKNINVIKIDPALKNATEGVETIFVLSAILAALQFARSMLGRKVRRMIS